MNNLIELGILPIKKKKQYYLDKEFTFDENNKEKVHKQANDYGFNKAILERDRRYHLETTENSFKINYRNQKSTPLL